MATILKPSRITFRQIENPLVGTEAKYSPTVTNPSPADDNEGVLILGVGDTVTVESAWTRDYLPENAPILFCVRSHETGQATHVVAADLVAVSA